MVKQREIMFRGKRIDNGEWVIGCYVFGGTNHYIIIRNGVSNQYIEVDPDTIGQYAGMKDKNGKRIFEDDIIRINKDVESYFRAKSGRVFYHAGSFFVEKLDTLSSIYALADIYFIFRGEVVGNIHDNPELLKEEK